MDIHKVIITAAEEILHGIEEARKELEGTATVDYPTRFEVEFGINGSYGVANYDDITIAKIRIQIPLFQQGTKDEISPASAALAEDKSETNTETEKPTKKTKKKE